MPTRGYSFYRESFFDTDEGRLCLLHGRRKRRFSLLVYQTPKSKNSISVSEERGFQNLVVGELKSFRRRAFRAPVIVETDYFINVRNPASIHSLNKNYLDLLQKPKPGVSTKRKALLLKDDNQVAVLITNYRLMPLYEREFICVKIEPLWSFIADLDLLQYIGHRRDINNSDELYELRTELDELWESKKAYISQVGEDNYILQEEFILERLQTAYLKNSGLRPTDIPYLLRLHSTRPNSDFGFERYLEEMGNGLRNMVLSSSYAVNLPNPPTTRGETRTFKEGVRTALSDFKDKYPLLFPLRVPLCITVLYLPPDGQIIDLDNLMRRVVPFVNNIIAPPSVYTNINKSLERVAGTQWKEKLLELWGNIPKEPRHTITRYQVIKIPRTSNDPPEGLVRIMFGDGSENQSFWDYSNGIIEDWEEELQRR